MLYLIIIIFINKYVIIFCFVHFYLGFLSLFFLFFPQYLFSHILLEFALCFLSHLLTSFYFSPFLTLASSAVTVYSLSPTTATSIFPLTVDSFSLIF
jgi:hypothetical protein